MLLKDCSTQLLSPQSDPKLGFELRADFTLSFDPNPKLSELLQQHYGLHELASACYSASMRLYRSCWGLHWWQRTQCDLAS